MASVWRYPRHLVFSDQHTPIYARRTPHSSGQPVHDHDFIEIVLVLRGSAWQQTPAGSHPIRRGDVIVLRPGAWHSYEKSRSLLIYNCCFGPELLRHELAWLMDEPALASLLWGTARATATRGVTTWALTSGQTVECEKALSFLEESLESRQPVPRAEQVARLVVFLAKVAAAMPPARVDERNSTGQRLHVAVATTIRLIETELARPWSLTELAAESRVSREYLIRLFKKVTGLTPLAYLARCRAEKAASLLVRSDQSIGEIGALVGWETPYHFARRFKAHFGIAASTYRRRHGKSAKTEF
jgi:AraC family L-rhamnose operon transcriptional activator RhaR